MFGIFKRPVELDVVKKPKVKVSDVKHEYELKIKELQKDNELAIKEKEFELRHFKDNEIKELQEKGFTLKQEIAVLKKENEMLEKITDLNADIIDIKDLVTKLIDKLPEIKLSNLTLGSEKNDKD